MLPAIQRQQCYTQCNANNATRNNVFFVYKYSGVLLQRECRKKSLASMMEVPRN